MTVQSCSGPCPASKALEGVAQGSVGFCRGEPAEIPGGVIRDAGWKAVLSRRRFGARWSHEHAQASRAILSGGRREELRFTKAQLRRECLVLDEQAQFVLIAGDDVAQAPEFFSEHAAQAPLQCDETFGVREHCAQTLSTIGVTAAIGRQQLLGPKGTLRTRFQ